MIIIIIIVMIPQILVTLSPSAKVSPLQTAETPSSWRVSSVLEPTSATTST